uniref:Uncharacterized protein n=1 Tax=Arundo donax TaxID=35708 RepID=A0A0A9AS18_ARUDO
MGRDHPFETLSKNRVRDPHICRLQVPY